MNRTWTIREIAEFICEVHDCSTMEWEVRYHLQSNGIQPVVQAGSTFGFSDEVRDATARHFVAKMEAIIGPVALAEVTHQDVIRGLNVDAARQTEARARAVKIRMKKTYDMMISDGEYISFREGTEHLVLPKTAKQFVEDGHAEYTAD